MKQMTFHHDMYFAIRYHRDGKLIEEAIGWQSSGFSAGYAAGLRGKIVQNIKKGENVLVPLQGDDS